MRVALVIFIIGVYFHEAASHPNAGRHAVTAKRSVGISGGHVIPIEQAPYVASLRCYQGGSERYVCGASIIHEWFVLTAASCIQENCEYRVAVGSNKKIGNEGQVSDVKNIILHPEFNVTNLDYDFALIELDQPVIFGPNVATINIHESDCDLRKNGTNVNVAGWGVTEMGCTAIELQTDDFPLVERKWCEDYYERMEPTREITQQMICAGALYHSTCAADNGDPLTLDGELVGVTSNMERNEECGTYAGVFAKVLVAKDWILENIA